MEGLSAILDSIDCNWTCARIFIDDFSSAGDALSLAFSEMKLGKSIEM